MHATVAALILNTVSTESEPMTNWRAVFAGFLAELVFNLLGIFVGIISPGIVEGLVAGYLSGTRLLSGAWHGLLAGALGVRTSAPR
jgi:hypothetical protein